VDVADVLWERVPETGGRVAEVNNDLACKIGLTTLIVYEMV